MKIEQAIRNAVEAEKAASRFYARLVHLARDDHTRAFLRAMSEQEQHHAEQVERLGRDLHSGPLPVQADSPIETVETAPAWDQAEQMDLARALDLALEAENHAALYYDAMSDFFQGTTAEFFRSLAKKELGHARGLIGIKHRLGA